MFKYSLLTFVLNIPLAFIMTAGCGWGPSQECTIFFATFLLYIVALIVCIILFNFKYSNSQKTIGINDDTKGILYIILITTSILPLLAGLLAFGDANF